LLVHTTLATDYRVTSSLTKITYCHSFVYKRLDQLTDKLSDSDEISDILSYIKSYNIEPLPKKVTDSINCEELAATSASIAPTCAVETRPRPTTRVGLVCICLCWYNFN